MIILHPSLSIQSRVCGHNVFV